MKFIQLDPVFTAHVYLLPGNLMTLKLSVRFLEIYGEKKMYNTWAAHGLTRIGT